MDKIIEKITEWLRGIIGEMAISSYNDAINDIKMLVMWSSDNLKESPDNWMDSVNITAMLHSIVENALIPIGGIILTYVVVQDFIQIILERNNMHEFDTSILFKFVFKAAVGVFLLAKCWDLTMAIFDIGSWVIGKAGDLTFINITENFYVSKDEILESFKQADRSMGDVFMCLLYMGMLKLSTMALYVSVYIVSIGRMIEIFLYLCASPVPVATLANKEWSDVGKNYLKSLFALALQGLFMIACIVIYCAKVTDLIGTVATTDWFVGQSAIIESCALGFVLCFMMFKTGSVSKSILGAH